jgi:DNA invertase Pin-like site-specific DNA recombinase
MMGVFAQYEKAMIVIKLRGSRQRAKLANGRCEGQKPYGFYPGESDVLTMIQNEADAGESAAGIARILNERGVKPRRGDGWHHYTVLRILRRAK